MLQQVKLIPLLLPGDAKLLHSHSCACGECGVCWAQAVCRCCFCFHKENSDPVPVRRIGMFCTSLSVQHQALHRCFQTLLQPLQTLLTCICLSLEWENKIYVVFFFICPLIKLMLSSRADLSSAVRLHYRDPAQRTCSSGSSLRGHPSPRPNRPRADEVPDPSRKRRE